MTSVARKSHMPSASASFCCSMSSNWWACRPAPCPSPWDGAEAGGDAVTAIRPVLSAIEESDTLWLHEVVTVRVLRHHGDLVEVVRRRGGRGLPFQTGRRPWVG